MPNRMAYLDREHRFTVKEEPVPEPGPGEVRVQIKCNGICGSDLHFYQDGRLGTFVVTSPYVPGHEACGVIAAVGEGVRGRQVGDRVVIEPGIPCGLCEHCRGGRYNLCADVVFLSAPPTSGTLCDYIAIRADAVHPMPDGMTFDQGALAEPVAVGVHAVSRGRVPTGATGVVLGCGPIGLVTLGCFKAAGGGRAVCVDPIRSRLDKAVELGADDVLMSDGKARLTDVGDVVFETAGSNAATAMAFQCARAGGTVVQVGWPPDNWVSLDVAGFVTKELDYVAVNRYANAFPTAIRWLADGRVNADALVTHRFSLDDVAEAFRFSLQNRDTVIKTIVHN